MPGQFIMPAGRPAARPGGRLQRSGRRRRRPDQTAIYDPGMGVDEPAPVGVVQANFSQSSPVGTPAATPLRLRRPAGRWPSRTSGHDPYQAKSGGVPHPHILGHLFGWSGLGAEQSRGEGPEEGRGPRHDRLRQQRESAAPVEELPASVVFGKKR